ncbi:MAG: hypothetical protein KF773_35580 [Deltaproteobacteria bacterium]|nr:hypothetical protein [Deltaproteobacteria bacterium]MCW5805425.1 hypothetical protein [Deltaproteobacteria bacterium]
MRRAAWLGLAGCTWCGLAAAAPATTLTAEAGAEADSNVERLERGPGIADAPVGAPVLRFGARVAHRTKLAGGTGVLALSGLSRIVGDGSVQRENVVFLTADARWAHPLPDRPVAAGLAVTAADAVPLTDSTGSRTFRNLGADGLLVLRAGDDKRDTPASLTFAFGARRFTYKPDSKFDWVGPAVNVRLDWMLWQDAAGTSSLELAGTAGVEARAYDSIALASNCNDMQPVDPAMCSARTSIQRQDRYQRAGVDLVWSSPRLIASGGYAVAVIDSNSFGQSLVRHRATASATTKLPMKLVGTAILTLQYDQFLDGLIVRKDTNAQLFTSIEDENRSSVQLRLARNVTRTWALESRLAMWRDIGGDPTTTFSRNLAYLGAIYVR